MPDIPRPLDRANVTPTPAHRRRRQFLKGGLGTLLAAALGYFGWTRYLFPPAAPLPQEPAHGKPGGAAMGMALGKVSDFPAGGPPKSLTVKVPGTDRTNPYIVENLGGGQFRVLSAVCTHQGCPVDWDPAQSRLACPCHGAQFDPTGRVLHGPARNPLATLASRVEGDTLYVTG